MHLLPESEVHFLVRRERPAKFFFEVTEPCKITLDSWDLNEEECSNTDIFIAANPENDDVTAQNCQWRSTFGTEKIVIYPDDENF